MSLAQRSPWEPLPRKSAPLMEGRLRVQVQVELAGADAARLWVAVEGSSSIRDVAAAVSAQFAKVRGHPVAVSELTLRGALLDPGE